MKKLLALVSICLMFSGCDDYDPRQALADQTTNTFRIVTWNGHEYVFCAQYRIGGMAHNPDCPCHKEQP